MNDLLDRIRAFDAGGNLTGWTPELVQARIVEAAKVITTIPMRIGPKRDSGYWPQVLMVAQDLVDDETQERVLANPRFNGDWMDFVDKLTKRRISENIQHEWDRPANPAREALSRAEEALRWPAVYLADKPLLADALTLWALCLGTGASLRLSLRKRAKDADAKMRAIGASRRQEAVPNKNFDLRLTWERRKAAADVVCAALREAKVAVREAPEDVSKGQSDD